MILSPSSKIVMKRLHDGKEIFVNKETQSIKQLKQLKLISINDDSFAQLTISGKIWNKMKL